jgi:hypothetical protein
MPDWYLFDTQQQAEAADSEISALMGCPIDGVNAATGAVDPDAQTARWAEPREAVEGWVIPVPDEPAHRIVADTIASPTFPLPADPEQPQR